MHNLAFGIDCALAALIWLVQVIVYPSFRYVDASRFKQWHAEYTRKMGYIVAPLMIVQLSLALHATISRPAVGQWSGLALVAGTWLSTFALSVPLHRRLQSRGKDESAIERLVSTNWIRVVLWTTLALRHVP